MEIQEIIARGRIILQGAPKRLEVFKLINGKRSANDIAMKTGRSLSSVLQDIQKMKDMDIVKLKSGPKNSVIRKDGSALCEKTPLIKHISVKYFNDPIKAKKVLGKKQKRKKAKNKIMQSLNVPSHVQILEICKNGEDQIYEFKESGISIDKISREIAAFANTKMGGIIFYGIDDDGTICGSDKHRQEMDQSIQNSIRNTIFPSLNILIREKDILGYKILLIITPSWNKKDVYHYKDRVLIRKGTNVFSAKPEESKKLHNGEYVI